MQAARAQEAFPVAVACLSPTGVPGCSGDPEQLLQLCLHSHMLVGSVHKHLSCYLSGRYLPWLIQSYPAVGGGVCPVGTRRLSQLWSGVHRPDFSVLHSFIIWQYWIAAKDQTHGPRHPEDT